MSPEIQNYNAPVDRRSWGNFPQCIKHHIWGTTINSGHHDHSRNYQTGIVSRKKYQPPVNWYLGPGEPKVIAGNINYSNKFLLIL